MYNQKYFMSAGIFYMFYITTESLIVNREFLEKKENHCFSQQDLSIEILVLKNACGLKKTPPYLYYELQRKWPIHIFHRKMINHSCLFFSSVLQTILVIFLSDVNKRFIS